MLASRGAAELLVLKDVVASPQMSTISAPNFGTPPHTVLLGTGRFRGGASASLITAELGAGSLSLIDSPGIPNPPVGGSIIEGPPLQAFAVGKFFGSFEEDVAYVSGNIDGPPSLKFLTGSAGGLSPEGASFGQGTDTEVLGSGDFDGDGQADLVALVVDQAEARHLKFFLQQSSGTFLATQIDLEGRPGRLTLGDLNGDGKTDIALSQDSAQQAQGGLNILLSN